MSNNWNTKYTPNYNEGYPQPGFVRTFPYNSYLVWILNYSFKFKWQNSTKNEKNDFFVNWNDLFKNQVFEAH